MLRRASLLLCAAVLLLAPAAARAADFCVAPASSCAPANTHAAVQDALDAAATAAGPDRVLIGAGTHTAVTTAGFSYLAATPVEIEGAGADTTTLTGPAGTATALTLGSSADGSTIRDLRVLMPASSPVSSTGVWLNGRLERARIERAAPQTQPGTGVQLESGDLDDVTVDLSAGANPNDSAITTNGAATTAVTDSQLTASNGVAALSGATMTVDRTRLTVTTAGFDAAGGTIHARNSLVQASGDVQALRAVAQPGGDGVIVADHVTVDGAGTGFGVRAANTFDPARSASVTLRNSIVRDFGTTLARAGSAPGSASILTAASDYDAGAGKVTEFGSGTLVQTGQTFTAGPLFTGPAFTLAANSALVDAAGDGSPTTPLDLAGAPRVVDGDGDCTATADVGAFEVQAGPWAACVPPAPPGGGGSPPTLPVVPPPVTTPPVVQPPAPPAVVRDRTAPGMGKLSVRRLRGGRARVRFALSETASVTIRAAGRTRRISARRGTVSVVVKVRRGRITVTATDPAGNRATRQARLR